VKAATAARAVTVAIAAAADVTVIAARAVMAADGAATVTVVRAVIAEIAATAARAVSAKAAMRSRRPSSLRPF
jgi:hypothetical protein